MRPKLLFVYADDRFFWSHRLALARAALLRGYEVVIAAGVYQYAREIEELGLRLIPLKLHRGTSSPFSEWAAVRQLKRIYLSERPDLIHQVAIKAMLFGSIAGFGRAPVPVVNEVTGLGYLATASSVRAALLRFVIWRAFRLFLNRRHQVVLVENGEDKQTVVNELKVPEHNVMFTRGPGVNVKVFRPTPESSVFPIVLLASRMLWIKGVREFVGAAQMLRKKGVPARFVLAGDSDSNNPSCVPRAQLVEWQASGAAEWWGHQQDMPGLFRQANLVCLPSHGGEGVPKVLMEAAASGRAIVTTAVPGCRDIVRDGINGLVVQPKDPTALAQAIETLLNDASLRSEMGKRGRDIAVREYSQEAAVRETLDLYERLLRPRPNDAA
ncbi:MAG TPA: glycosyltransferase family 4 protein [Stellaceae bacterium]|nr:glycosyltransferase family 4 protein [Stellaceae bacterium]